MPTLDPINDEPAGGWPDPDSAGKHLHFDFEAEPDLSGDGSGDPNIYHLTIADPEGEEIATVCHRASDAFPIDGVLAERKRLTGRWIAAALDAYEVPQPTVDDARRSLAGNQGTPLSEPADMVALALVDDPTITSAPTVTEKVRRLAAALVARSPESRHADLMVAVVPAAGDVALVHPEQGTYRLVVEHLADQPDPLMAAAEEISTALRDRL